MPRSFENRVEAEIEIERKGARNFKASSEVTVSRDSEYLVIKLKRSLLAEDEDDRLIAALVDGTETPPFALPRFVKWPKGERKGAERALILLRAGLEHLVGEFKAVVTSQPPKETVAQKTAEQSTKIEGW